MLVKINLLVMKNRLILFFLILLGAYVQAQDLNGRVVDQFGEPVAYANIGYLSFPLGTVTNSNGEFTLNFDRAEDSRIAISCIGYKKKEFKAIKLKFDLKKGHDIIIDKIAYDLPEVEVRPREWVTKRVGTFARNEMVSAGFSENILGKEAGVRMKIKNKPAYIEEVHVYIARCAYDSIFFRLNVYEMDGKDVGSNILTEPIYIDLSREEVEDKIVIDLKKYNIRVEDDFLVSLEQVSDLGEGGLFFASKIFKPTYYRYTSQAPWSKVGLAGISIGCVILQEK